MIHAVKTLPTFFDDVVSGRKGFEVRKNDRDYRVGDLIALNEWDGDYTGRCCLVYIDYVLANEEYCKEGFAVLGIKPCEVLVFNKRTRHDPIRPYGTYEVPIVQEVEE